MSKANERAAMYMDKKEAFEDRQLFVRNLGELLAQTREGIIGCDLNDDEIVSIHYIGGYIVQVNVNMDSYSSIVKDIANHAF